MRNKKTGKIREGEEREREKNIASMSGKRKETAMMMTMMIRKRREKRGEERNNTHTTSN